MSESDERLEQLIGRKLDGELLTDESLELDKCLIRDPAARKCLEDSHKIDALAATFLNEVCGEFDESSSGVQVAAARPRRRWAWLGTLPPAAAACLAMLFLWPVFFPDPADHSDDAGQELRSIANGTPARISSRPVHPLTSARLVGNRERSEPPVPRWKTGTQVDVYGVLDEATDKLYLLGVEHMTSAQRRNAFRGRTPSAGGVRLASGEM